jgi:transposase
LSNGETVLESLAHSRYLLFKYSDEWSASQERRANALFLKFPEIKKVYERSCEFRNWMKRDNVGKCMRNIKDELRTWMQNVERDNVDEMLNFKSLIERHMLPVLNYFRFGVTNAIAENINSHIQKFVTINQGTRDREFFYFRMKKYFT